MQRIPNDRLTAGVVPADDAPWDSVSRFALTFDGYDFAGGFQECADIAKNPNHSDLSELRTALFCEQRRWRHFGDGPRGPSRAHIYSLLQHIRALVAAADRDAPA